MVNIPKNVLNFNNFYILLIFTLPFGEAFKFPFLILSFIFYLKERKFKEVEWKKNYAFIFFILFTSFLYIKEIFYGSLLDDFDLNGKLFVIFFLIQFSLVFKNKIKGEKAFILGVIVSIILSSINIVIHYINNQEIPLSSGNIVNDLLQISRPHLGIFIVTSLFIILKNISSGVFSKAYYGLAFVQFAFVVFISARLAIGLSLLIILIYIYQKYKKQKKKLGLFAFLTIALSVIIINNPILKKRLHIQDGFKIDIEKTLAYEPRYIIYPCALGIIENGVPFFGFSGGSEVQAQLNHCYSESIERSKKRAFYLEKEFHTHNAFFNFILLGGIPGILLFLGIIGYPLISPDYSIAVKSMLGIFICFFLVENVLDTDHGSIFFGIFYLYYYKYSLDRNNYDRINKSAS